jgi:Flp pilus assembly protein TadD
VLDAPLDRSEALIDAASTLYKTNRNLPLAADLVRRYLVSAPSDQAPAFKAHVLLGNILAKQGNKQGAEGEYRTALTLAKNYEPAQEGLKRLNS